VKRDEYLKTAFEKFNNGEISAEAYDAILMNEDLFSDDGEEWDDAELEREAEDPAYESLESHMFHASMEQSAREATQEFKVAYKIECSGNLLGKRFLRDCDRDYMFFSLDDAEDFCKKERGPYNRLGIELTPVEVRIPVKATVEQNQHSTYKNMRFVPSEER